MLEEKYKPLVTIQELLNFDPAKEETYTRSRFMNIFLNHFLKRRGVVTMRQMAELMGLNHRCAAEMFQAEAGMTFQDFTNYYMAWEIHKVVGRYEEFLDEEKDVINEQLENFEEFIPKADASLQRKLEKLTDQCLDIVNHAHSLTYEELASKLPFSRSGLYKFVHSKRYEKIVRELDLRRFTNAHSYSRMRIPPFSHQFRP